MKEINIKSRSYKNFLITGGMGFIGSNFIKFVLENTDANVFNLDNMSVGSNIQNLSDFAEENRYKSFELSINDDSILEILKKHKIDCIVNFAAESHVDRSLENPLDFFNSNAMGTLNLLIACQRFSTDNFIHFHQISTDEVFGSLKSDDLPFSEENQFQPNSPYSASKASADHLVRAWHHSYGLNVTTSNCSNNYGPRQFQEKLIPKIIQSCLNGNHIPIYGDGLNIRDWLYVDDHCEAIFKIITSANFGETYNIGGKNEITNNDIVKKICSILEDLVPVEDISPLSNKRLQVSKYIDLVEYVSDRPGHDFRYSIDPKKIENDLDWRPKEDFDSGIRKTIHWYLENIDRLK
tara:strand:+ start:5761 stop:6813 length:1053 start_codon:yes stop_codon:yes gene_type:complete